MHQLPEDPFPFCTLCATWHAKGQHVHPMWASEYRLAWLRPDHTVSFALGMMAGVALGFWVFG